MAQENPEIPIIEIKPLNQHCTLFTDSVPIPNFDPTNPQVSLTSVEITEPILGGCYPTIQEALSEATGGRLNIPDNATHDEISEAINMYVPLPVDTSSFRTSATSAEQIMSSGTANVYAIAYDHTNFTGASFTHLDLNGNLCSLGEYYHVEDYGSYNWDGYTATVDNDIDSVSGYNGCDDLFFYQEPYTTHGTNSPFFYVYRYTTKVKHDYWGDYRGWISQSFIGDWPSTHW